MATAGDEVGLERLVSFADFLKKAAAEKLYALKLESTICGCGEAVGVLCLSSFCEKCGQTLCDDCVNKCTDCETVYCENCTEKHLQACEFEGNDCGGLVCKTCVVSAPCKNVHGCNTCLDDYECVDCDACMGYY